MKEFFLDFMPGLVIGALFGAFVATFALAICLSRRSPSTVPVIVWQTNVVDVTQWKTNVEYRYPWE